ncbi:MAG: hypothetical protein EOP54_01050 [Sphingobacteriales bacterium]|nr:MAG: hypothetical protein EOP54_01050 [Sphingobacteriales bacterium]
MAKKSTSPAPPVYSRCLLLSVYETDAMVAARIRGLLSHYFYIELQNSFFISCESELRPALNKILMEENICFSMIYISDKAGNMVSGNRLPEGDLAKLKKIV